MEELNKANKTAKRRKLDLAKIFDLSKIPEEELRRQHYDLSLRDSLKKTKKP